MFLSTQLERVPFLVLGNKVDLPYAASESELRYALGLLDTTGYRHNKRNNKERPIEVFMCSVIRRMGYADGFE